MNHTRVLLDPMLHSLHRKNDWEQVSNLFSQLGVSVHILGDGWAFALTMPIGEFGGQLINGHAVWVPSSGSVMRSTVAVTGFRGPCVH